jgi:hypothetical protein
MLIPLGILGAAGAFDSDYELINTQIISGTGITAVGFENYPMTYKQLQVRIVYQVNTSTTANYGLVLSIGSSVQNHSVHHVFGNGSAVNSRAQSSTYTSGGGLIPYPQPAAFGGTINPSSFQSQFVAGIIDILDYASTTKNKTLRVFSGHTIGSSSNVTLGSGLVNTTSAMNTFTFYAANGPAFTVGSRFSLYGIRG